MVRGKALGNERYGTAPRKADPGVQIFAMSTPVYAGWVFDRTDSYSWALPPIVLIYAAATFLFWVLPKPKVPVRLGGQVVEPRPSEDD